MAYTDVEILAELKRTFGLQDFRMHQKEIISATLEQRDTFLVLATGRVIITNYQTKSFMVQCIISHFKLDVELLIITLSLQVGENQYAFSCLLSWKEV